MERQTRRPRGTIHVYGENQPNVAQPIARPVRQWRRVDDWLSDVSDHENAERDRMMSWDRIEPPVNL